MRAVWKDGSSCKFQSRASVVTAPRQGKRSAVFRGGLCVEKAKADARNVTLAEGATEKRQEIIRVPWPGLATAY